MCVINQKPRVAFVLPPQALTDYVCLVKCQSKYRSKVEAKSHACQSRLRTKVKPKLRASKPTPEQKAVFLSSRF